MDLTRFLPCLILLVFSAPLTSAAGVFNLQHKFAGRGRSLKDFKEHDSRRHARLLGSIDLPMAGMSLPTQAGLYFAEIRLGTPPKKYYVQVDTGSDILWVNCIECTQCPRKSELGIKLTLYDIKKSSSGNIVSCNQPFCIGMYNGLLEGCTPAVSCQYSLEYGDGSTSSGYFVKDLIGYDQVSGNLQTKASNTTVAFGCGGQQSGDLGTSERAVDGILGLGQSNSSLVSQLATSGKVKKMFAHCLDSVNGGGIFAIGHVVEPKVTSTPLLQNRRHYNVKMTAIEVGGNVLQLPSDVFDSEGKGGTVIDSGTTLAYVPDTIYSPLINAITSSQSSIKLLKVPEDFLCFQYVGSVDDGFPPVKLYFENSLSFVIYPHDYLFLYRDGLYCLGWQNSDIQSKDTKQMILLGDLVLANKLVVYDLENQVIGWKDYNCSSNIKVQDDETGAVYTVGSHNLSSVGRLEMCSSVFLLLTLIMLNHIC